VTLFSVPETTLYDQAKGHQAWAMASQDCQILSPRAGDCMLDHIGISKAQGPLLMLESRIWHGVYAGYRNLRPEDPAEDDYDTFTSETLQSHNKTLNHWKQFDPRLIF
jgi:hypothetical protein